MNTREEIAKAKELLKNHGYYTDNLWCIEDVQYRFICSDEEAYEILDGALNNEATMEQIWFAIDMYAEEAGLTETAED
jgi:hypothetical protein